MCPGTALRSSFASSSHRMVVNGCETVFTRALSMAPRSQGVNKRNPLTMSKTARRKESSQLCTGIFTFPSAMANLGSA